MPNDPFVVAVVQAAPVDMGSVATIDKACELILEAGRHGARLIAFPESFIPGYPDWVWTVPAGDEAMLKDLYAEFLENAVTIPSDAFDKVCRIARRAKTHVVVGVSERNAEASGGSLYNSLVYIDAQGQILGKHRRLVLTGGERMVWAQGDGSTLDVYNTPLGKLGGLIGWENYMPLARYALYSRGVQLYVAPTRDRGEPWLATLRHIAKEGRMYVLSPGCVLARDAVPDRTDAQQKLDAESREWLKFGGSVIVNPEGAIIAGPASQEQEILYAEVDPRQMRGPKWMLDVAGHSARPDVFRLLVNRQARELVSHEDGAREHAELEPINSTLRGI